MPAYNAERYIADSIRSVLAQTYEKWELIVVDDGSTDRTGAIVRELASHESRIKYVYQTNGRLGKARNNGILNSSGRLLAFLDSDDLWLPQKLELQVRVQQATTATLVFTGGYIFFGDDATDETKALPIVAGRLTGHDLIDRLLNFNFIPVMSVMMERQSFDNTGPFEEAEPYHGCEDYDLWLKLAKHGAVFFGMEEELVRYRRHPNAMTHKDSNVLKPMLRIVSRHINDGKMSEDEKKHRIRQLYRELIGALLVEGKSAEAAEWLKELAAWDKSGFVTAIQKLLFKLPPRIFNFVSRECLYRVEWHLGNSSRSSRSRNVRSSKSSAVAR